MAITRASLNQEYYTKVEDLKEYIEVNNTKSIGKNNKLKLDDKDLKKQLKEEYILKFRDLKTDILTARALQRQVCHTYFYTNASKCPNMNLCLATHAINCQIT